jgi:hypothetical protein
MSDPTEREELESLLASPGWHRLMSYAKRSYAGDAYALRIKQAIKHALDTQKDVSAAVQVVDAESTAIDALVSWPVMRVRDLLMQEQQREAVNHPHPSRRGGL